MAITYPIQIVSPNNFRELIMSENLNFNSIGGITVGSPPVIVDGNNTVLLANGSIIQSVSLESGVLLGSYTGHTNLVTSIVHSKSTNDLFRSANGKEEIAISTSLDGTILVWDVITFKTFAKYDIGSPVMGITFQPKAIANKVSDQEKYVASIVVAKSESEHSKIKYEVQSLDIKSFKNTKLSTLSLPSSRLIDYLNFPLFKNSSTSKVAPLGTCLVVAKKKSLYFHVLSDKDYTQPFRYEMDRDIVKIAVCQLTGMIAVGIKTGEIILLHNVQDFVTTFWVQKTWDTNILAQTHLHWHAHAVLSLQFSSHGKHLYSGGEENVFVLWNIAKLSKNFLPRLGSPIYHMTVSMDANRVGKVLLSGLDNSIRLLNTATLTIEWYYQSLYVTPYHKLVNKDQHSISYHSHYHSKGTKANQFRDALLESLYPTKLIDQQSDEYWSPTIKTNPLNGTLVTNGKSPQLQMFDPLFGSVKSSLDIVNFNRVSRKDSNKSLYVPSIPHYAFDHSGKLLVTVDVIQGEELDKEYSLKFWEYGMHPKKQSATAPENYQLTAQFGAPHDTHPITVMKVVAVPNPLLPDYPTYYVATASYDGTVKVWKGEYIAQKPPTNIFQKPMDAKTKAKQGVKKENEEEIKYKLTWRSTYSFHYRVAFITAMCWSADGSMLVVAYENMITFWDSVNVQLKKHLMLTDSITSIANMEIIEPQPHTPLDGATAIASEDTDAYLMVTTQTNLIAYSLLKFQELWSIEKKYITANAFAKHAHDTFSSSTTNATTTRSIASNGWIAIATAKYTTPDTITTETETVTTKSDNKNTPAAAASSSSSVATFEVFIFSPLSSTPLCHKVVSAKVVSITFLEEKISCTPEEKMRSPHGLVILTADSEVLLLNWNTQDLLTQAALFAQQPIALIQRATLPVLIGKGEESIQIILKQPLSAEELVLKEKSKTLAATSHVQGNQHWLKRFLPDNSADLPKSSEIATDFIKSLIPAMPMDLDDERNHNQGSRIVQNPFDFLERSMEARQEKESQAATTSSFTMDPALLSSKFPSSATQEVIDIATVARQSFAKLLSTKRKFEDFVLDEDEEDEGFPQPVVEEKKEVTKVTVTEQPPVVIEKKSKKSKATTVESTATAAATVAVEIVPPVAASSPPVPVETKTSSKRSKKEKEAAKEITKEEVKEVIQEIVNIPAPEPEGTSPVIEESKGKSKGKGKSSKKQVEETPAVAIAEEPVAVPIVTTEEVEAPKKGRRGRKAAVAVTVVEDSASIASMDDDASIVSTDDDNSIASQTRNGKRRRTLQQSQLPMDSIPEDVEVVVPVPAVMEKKSRGRGKKETAPVEAEVPPAAVPATTVVEDKSERRSTRTRK